ncbi:MAG: cobaltochelatase subunit CobN [Candidatus Methanoplasma sp.]|jgi:cobaltochelatase CobN|nr:cobaltochelatase subunit CobN [Candidatus Methanoplasma sp.]
MSKIRIVHLSIQSTDARSIEAPAREVREEDGIDIDLFCMNGEHADADPLAYSELVEKSREADLILIRCMSDPTRMKRFAQYEKALAECRGGVVVNAINLEVRLAYKSLFKWSEEDFVLVGEYARHRGAENDKALIRWLNCRVAGVGEPPAPVKNREHGIYHAGFPRDVTREEYLGSLKPGLPSVAIFLPVQSWLYGNTAHIDALVEEFESIGVNTVPIFFSGGMGKADEEGGTLSLIREYLMDGDRCIVDAIITTSHFSQISTLRDSDGVRTLDDANFYRNLTDVPVLLGLTSGGEYADFESVMAGNKGEFNMNVIWPEVDGNIITVPFGAPEGGPSKSRAIVGIPDRIRHLAAMTKMWAKLRRIPRSERRVAILMYQSRPDSGRIGNAAGLDTIESVKDMLHRMRRDGYSLDHVPETARDLIGEIMDGITNDLEWSSPERVREKAADLMSRGRYMESYSELSGFNRGMMEEKWGDPPGEICVDGGEIVIPGLVNGNVFIGYQPMRGWAEQMEAVYHSPVMPMTHQYLAFYRWLKRDFKADVVVHVGTHGTLEWLPGKSAALSGKCFPDIVLDGIPHIYPYIIDDPGEGIQAKRRSEAVLIGHMCPSMARAGTYDELAVVDNPLQEYFKLGPAATGERKAALVRQVLEGVRKADMFGDIGAAPDISPEEFEGRIGDLHDYIVQIKDSIVRDGLHVLGKVPEGPLLDEMIYSLTRMRNGDTPSLRDSVADAMGYDLDALLDDPSGMTGGELNAALIDRADAAVQSLLEEMRALGYDAGGSIAAAERIAGRASEKASAAIGYVCGTLVPNIRRMSDEMDNMFHGFDGGYVLPGPSGAPTRGNAHLLPMGRNYYGIDPAIVPIPAAWDIGVKMADQMIRKHIDEKGCYPREVGFIIWATDTMKTNGDDVAYILWLMGVRPVWSQPGGQVTGLEVIPLSELGRPRIDVTVRITGLFRDTFPNLIDLIDDAVKLVSALDESEEDNYLAANLRRDIIESMAGGLTVDEAIRQNSVRIFGCAPGSYGTGIDHAIESGEWKTVQDLADIYITWGSYAYGRGMSGEGMRDQFVKSFSRVGVTVKNMPDKEIDALDADDVYGYLGGMNAFVRAYGKKDAMSVIGDGSNPERLKVRDAKEELQLLFRSKVLNPKFIEGLKRHGYRGVTEVANLTEFTFGWDATSDVVDDWMYEKLAERYLFDDDTREWMEDENPHAMMDVMDRLMEAYDRGMWDAKPETLDRMREIYLELEERIEEVTDR